MSKLRSALGNVDDTKLANELHILETNVIIEKPSFRFLQIMREFSADARTFLTRKCSIDEVGIERLNTQIALLHD